MTPEQLLGPLNDVECANAPERLYVSGDVKRLATLPRVAIVGSRQASQAGLVMASNLASQLAERGIGIVSGLAMGVDTAAHLGAIEAGGFTIAVLGTPLDKCAVSANRDLQALIARDHLAVTQFEQGSRVFPGNFPKRNRVMALMCHASIIIEAGDSSGTLSQGWEALRLGRPLYLSAQVLANKSIQWPETMIAHGAMPLPDELDDLIDQLPSMELSVVSGF